MSIHLPLSLAVCGTLLVATCCRANYTLVDSFSGETFFDNFTFYSDKDPTNGFVQYVNSSTAMGKNYSGVVETSSGQSVYLGVDQSRAAPVGRQAVRITSRASWTHGLLLADIRAVPTGCGLWPALWLVNPQTWPGSTGEIDVFESVHDSELNTMSLHTSPDCMLWNVSSLFSGHMITSNCDVNAEYQAPNAGCSIEASFRGIAQRRFPTAGSEFNRKGGGLYVMEWTSASIAVFFFPRDRIPSDIRIGHPTPSSWTEAPLARFMGSSCNLDGHIANLSLVINTDICGDWAGQTWVSSGCASKTGVDTCENYMSHSPRGLSESFWLINKIDMYKMT